MRDSRSQRGNPAHIAVSQTLHHKWHLDELGPLPEQQKQRW